MLDPFTALPVGDELDAGARAMDVDTHIPLEDLKVTWENLHLIQNAPQELPFLKDLKTCKLTSLEAQKALDQLKKGDLHIHAKEQKNSI